MATNGDAAASKLARLFAAARAVMADERGGEGRQAACHPPAGARPGSSTRRRGRAGGLARAADGRRSASGGDRRAGPAAIAARAGNAAARLEGLRAGAARSGAGCPSRPRRVVDGGARSDGAKADHAGRDQRRPAAAPAGTQIRRHPRPGGANCSPTPSTPTGRR